MTQAENRNPGKRGHASGADRKTGCPQDTARATGAQFMNASAVPAKGDGFTREKLAWLEAVTDCPGLPKAAHRLAAKLALRFLSRERGIAWPSVATLSDALKVDRKAILTAIAALEVAGLLAVARSKGRGHANEYTPTIPARKGGEIATFSDPIKGGENATFSTPRKGGVSAPEKVVDLPPHSFEENPLKGAGAHGARPLPYSELGNGDEVLDLPAQDAALTVGGALERAPDISEAELADLLDAVPDHLTGDDAGDVVQDGEPVTLADLDRIEAEERAAVVALAFSPSDPEADPVADAADAWAALHGAALDDAETFALDVLDGFPDGDPDAATRAATTGARLLMACGSSRAAVPIWAEHREIMRRLFCATTASHARAEAALSAYHVAVRTAGDAARRKTATRPAAANSETVTLGAAADV